MLSGSGVVSPVRRSRENGSDSVSGVVPVGRASPGVVVSAPGSTRITLIAAAQIAAVATIAPIFFLTLWRRCRQC